MIYLLCDAQAWTASFGKINLKNLKKLQKLDISGDDFVRASGLKKASSTITAIHDQITHRAIPQSVKKYLENEKGIAYKASVKKLPFLPLANPINELKKSSGREDYNKAIERLADKVEGRYRGQGLDTVIGNTIRKKRLTKAEQIATNMQRSPIVDDLINTKREPTQQDVLNLIEEARAENRTRKRQPKKIRGEKPERNIEENKYNLKMRQLERKYGIQ